jgi:hypothetical protein
MTDCDVQTTSTPSRQAVSKEQWLAFASRLIALAYAIFGEAKIDITERLFGEPKILSLALLCRTVGNFKGVVALTKEGLVVEARTLTRSCYENLYCMAALIEQGDDFVKGDAPRPNSKFSLARRIPIGEYRRRAHWRPEFCQSIADATQSNEVKLAESRLHHAKADREE